MKVKLYFLIIVGIQLIAVWNLARYILENKERQKILSSVDAIKKSKDIAQKENGDLKYYYTLEQSSISTETRYWDDKSVTYYLNSDGLNDRFNYSVTKPENTYRIITLGDSFTFGLNVNTSSNWTEKIEDILNSKSCTNIVKVEVINLGVWGYDIAYIIKRYKDLGVKYTPDLIIWYESGSGYYRNLEEMFPLINNCMQDVKTKTGREEVKPDKISKCWNSAQDTVLASKTVKENHDRITELLENFLSEINNTNIIIASSKNVQDQFKSIYNPLLNTYKNLYITGSVTELGDYNGTILFDSHPNEKGHETIANDIAKFITWNKNLGINCN